MTVLTFILSYLFIGFICCVIVTYLDVKYDFSGSKWRNWKDNTAAILSILLWPLSIGVILMVFFGNALDSAVNKLREVFEKNSHES